MILLLLALTAPAAVKIGGRPAKAWATSELPSRGARYAPKNAFDGDPATAWVEGVPGLGEGEALVLELDQPAQVSGFVLTPGYARSAETLSQNGAPRKLEIAADGKPLLSVEVPWVEERPEEAERCVRTASPSNLAPRLVVLERPLTARRLELRLAGVAAGTRFEDTAISEWQPVFEAPPPALRKAWDALVSIRDGQPMLAGGAQADALLPWSGGPRGPEFPEYGRFVGQRLGGAPLAPAQAFLKALAPELIGRAVLVEGPRLLGAMSFTVGDGEWHEQYPELVLDGQGRIAGLHLAYHEDGAPGCRRALPPALP